MMNYVNKEAGASGPQSSAKAGHKIINLALQGGGTHGAFTWGVLDRLLEDERIGFDGVTASSAGAVNAVLLVSGLATGGREGARNLLRTFWQRLSQIAVGGVFQPSLIDQLDPTHGLEHSPGYLIIQALTYYASPYQVNPFNLNPVKTLVEEMVDFDAIRRQRAVKLFLCATNVRTAKVKVFSGDEITVESVLASTCLPLLMQAVEIGGECYWDGGYAGNPAVFPLVYECETPDIVLVHTTPAERSDVPKSSLAIMNRMQEISFNTALIREMRAVAFLNRRIEEGSLRRGRRLLVHVIEGEDLLRDFTASSRLNCDWPFLLELFASGRQRAEQWLSANFGRIGVETTVDLDEKYF